ncbi:MAG: sulfatase [Bryobacteraceae bacterium]
MASRNISRRGFVCAAAGLFASTGRGAQRAPNLIIILADDLGYGDLGCYGSEIPTPNLDRMAKEGARLTQFYSASPVCSPSRAALLTGRYPVRTGVTRVLLPTDSIGLSSSETTIGKVLKQQDYRTMCVGKWHLGVKQDHLPTQHGFDSFYGLLYSNDMSPLPLMSGTRTLEELRDQSNLTARYTEQAVNFITAQSEQPFFLYLAHSMPHIPLAASAAFHGKSGLGAYGDAVMEMDWSVGKILEALKDNGLDQNTLVVFTSDNGPWYQGGAGRLRGRKGSTFEGGVREPFLARMPGTIPAGSEPIGMASMMDLLPTLAGMAGAQLPFSVDGVDILPMLKGDRAYMDRDALLYFDDQHLQCARWGPWKLHFARYNSPAWTPEPPGGRRNLPLPHPELYNVVADPSEAFDLASEHPDIVTKMRAMVDAQLQRLPDVARIAWRDTMAIQVQETPAGALPAAEGN